MIFDIVGAPYEGKTIYLNYLTYCAYKNGLDCYTNFYSKYSKKLDNLEQLEKLEYVDDAHTFIGLDDFISWLDCRMAMKNTVFTWIFNHYRKKGLVIGYDEQVHRSVDLRLSEITDIFFFTKQVKFPTFQITPMLPDGQLASEPFLIEYGKEIYDTYDTLEIVEKIIRLSEITKLYNSVKNVDSGMKKLFALRLKSKYGISKDSGELILSLVEAENNEVLEEMFKDLGFKFIGDL